MENRLKSMMQTNQRVLELSILLIYKHQTEDEKITGETNIKNSIGFSGCDSKTLSYYAKWLKKGNHLSGKFLVKAKEKMPKYTKQIAKHLQAYKEEQAPKKKMGVITVKQKGLLQVYDCSCGAGCVEADEGGYYCIDAPEYGLNGCGAVLMKGEEN